MRPPIRDRPLQHRVAQHDGSPPHAKKRRPAPANRRTTCATVNWENVVTQFCSTVLEYALPAATNTRQIRSATTVILGTGKNPTVWVPSARDHASVSRWRRPRRACVSRRSASAKTDPAGGEKIVCAKLNCQRETPSARLLALAPLSEYRPSCSCLPRRRRR